MIKGLTKKEYDFSETFSPVVKPSSMRVILTLADVLKWKIHQLDIKNAFVNGVLNETVYIHQPPVFKHKKYPNHVCKPHKVLYGHKQAPRAWFDRFCTFFIAQGFFCS